MSDAMREFRTVLLVRAMFHIDPEQKNRVRLSILTEAVFWNHKR